MVHDPDYEAVASRTLSHGQALLAAWVAEDEAVRARIRTAFPRRPELVTVLERTALERGLTLAQAWAWYLAQART